MIKPLLIVFLIIIITILHYNYKNQKSNIRETFINSNIIPKVVYQTYSDIKDIPYELTKCSKNVIMRNNPDYKYKLYTNKEIIKYIKETWGDLVLQIYLLIDESYGPARADLFRYLLLYDKGGIYLDIKSSIKTSFDEVFKPNDEFILTHWSGKRPPHYKLLKNKRGEMVNWFIACRPRHPFLKEVIKNVLLKILQYNKYKVKIYGKLPVLRLTGPIVYSQTILKMIRNNTKYKYRIVNNYKQLNLVYACRNHIKLTKNHYKYNKKNIINYNEELDEISEKDIDKVINI